MLRNNKNNSNNINNNSTNNNNNSITEGTFPGKRAETVAQEQRKDPEAGML